VLNLKEATSFPPPRPGLLFEPSGDFDFVRSDLELPFAFGGTLLFGDLDLSLGDELSESDLLALPEDIRLEKLADKLFLMLTIAA
jgi:hypothetical protein